MHPIEQQEHGRVAHGRHPLRLKSLTRGIAHARLTAILMGLVVSLTANVATAAAGDHTASAPPAVEAGRKSAQSPVRGAAEGLLADRDVLARLTQGTMSKFRFADAAKPLPEVTWRGEDGATHSSAEWRGSFILLNVWASWCAPCREEMPSLQRLSNSVRGEGPKVVLLSIDKSPAAAQDFLEQIGVKDLTSLRDPDLAISKQLDVRGAPTTLLIDPNGRELGRIEGAARWDSVEALLLLKAVVAKAR